jgi:hypothetical protein
MVGDADLRSGSLCAAKERYVVRLNECILNRALSVNTWWFWMAVALE